MMRTHMMVGPQAPFAGNSAWYRGDSTTQTVDGQPVATWADKSVLVSSLTAAGGARPTYRATGGPNSTPCVEADGVANSMINATAVSACWTSAAGTVYLVWKGLAAGGNAADSVVNPTMWGNAGGDLSMVYTSDPRLVIGRNGNVVNNGANLSTGTWYCTRVRWDGADLFILNNGGTEQTAASSGSLGIADFLRFFDVAGVRFFNGSFADFITFKSNLATGNSTDTAVRTYILSRYLITL